MLLDAISFCLAGNYHDAWKLKLKFLRDLLGLVSRRISYVFPKPYPVTINTNSKTPRGRVLFSYLENPLRWSEDHRGFGGHTNQWESREIVRIFTDLGYQVDAINWSDNEFVPQQSYEVCFDISGADLIVQSLPDLESHIFIDNHNNIICKFEG